MHIMRGAGVLFVAGRGEEGTRFDPCHRLRPEVFDRELPWWHGQDAPEESQSPASGHTHVSHSAL